MSWVRLDDGFPRHRKVRRLSHVAFRLHVSAICWCAEQLTDGLILTGELEDVSDLTARELRKAVPELISRGLWEPRPDGWVIHDYLNYNPSRDKVIAERERAAKRQQAWRDRQRNAVADGRDGASDDTRSCTTDDGKRAEVDSYLGVAPTGNTRRAEPADNAEPQVTAHDTPSRNGVTNGVTNASVTGAPSRPVPSPPLLLTERPSLTKADARVPPAEREKDQDLAWVVADAVEAHTGKRITLDHAQKIATKLLDGRVRIGNKPAYLRTSIANDPVGWLRFGETGHETLARLMGLAQTPPRSPQEPAQTAESPPARPDTPDTPRVAPEAVSGLTPDGGPVGELGSAQRAELLRKIRRGTVLKTPKPAVPRIQRTSPDQPDLVPDTGIDELEQARKRQAAASLAEFTRAYEAGEKPWEDKPARRETS